MSISNNYVFIIKKKSDTEKNYLNKSVIIELIYFYSSNLIIVFFSKLPS